MKKLLVLFLSLALCLPAAVFAETGSQETEPADAVVTEEVIPQEQAESEPAEDAQKTEPVEEEPADGTENPADVTDESDEAGETDEDDEPEAQNLAEDETEKTVTVVRFVRLPLIAYIGNVRSGVLLHWDSFNTKNVEYLVVYRRKAGEDKWESVKKITDLNRLYLLDTAKLDNGARYNYYLKACRKEKLPESEAAAVKAADAEKFGPRIETRMQTITHLERPDAVLMMRTGTKKWQASWSLSKNVTGYQVQYGHDGLFLSKTTVLVKDPDKAFLTAKVDKTGRCYARVRSYKESSTGTAYSAWTYSENSFLERNLSVTYLKNAKGKALNFTKLSGQTVPGYDTFQGSCGNGKFSWNILYNRYNERCRITKVRLSDGKVVKVSGVLKVNHGNDITYNSKEKVLVIVHYTGKPWGVTLVDPKTLKVIANKTVTRPKSTYNASAATVKEWDGITGIAYNASRDVYVASVKGTQNYVILDKNFCVEKYIKVSDYDDYTPQGVEVTDEFILRAQSPQYGNQKWNIISVYDWFGNYVCKIKTHKAAEAEGVFIAKGKLYGTLYHYYVKTKKVKVKGKKKKKTVVVPCRDNHIYRIG